MEQTKTHQEQLHDDDAKDRDGGEFSDTEEGRAALDRWARLQDESNGC